MSELSARVSPPSPRSRALVAAQAGGILLVAVLLDRLWFSTVRIGTPEALVGSLFVPLWMAGASWWLLRRRMPDLLLTRGGKKAGAWAAGSLLAIAMLSFGATLGNVPFEMPDLNIRLAQHLCVLLLVPLAEEFFFRGVLYRLVVELIGPLWGALVVSVLFGFLHPWIPFGWVMVLLSLVLCAAVYTTGTLWWAFILHLAWNGWAEAYNTPDSTHRYLLIGIGVLVGLLCVWRGLATKEKA